MSMVEVKVKGWGNSIGVIIPWEIAEHEGIHKGDTIKIDILNARKVDGFGILKSHNLPSFEREKDDKEREY